MTKEQIEALMEWVSAAIALENDRGGAEEMRESRARFALYRALGLSEMNETKS